MPGVTPALAPRLKCGIVRVPRNHERPDGLTYALAVVVIAPEPPATHPDPVIHISGGPGSPLTKYAAYQAAHPYAPGRDTILVDQRGMGASEPKLCPKHESALLPAVVHAIARDRADVDAVQRVAYAACRDEAVQLGYDLQDFGTVVTVEDLEDVRVALGVARWNVDGVSYGTDVAMTMAARHPETVRAVVLDSLYPPDPAPDFEDNVQDARAAFFADCATQPACNAAYPGLDRTYDEAVARLGPSPLPLTPSADGAPDRLTPRLFEEIVALLLYAPSAYPTLPRLIRDVRDGHPLAIGRAASALYAGREESFPAGAAVQCRDRPHLRASGSSPSRLGDGLADICPAWSPLGPPPIVPIGSPVPFLVMAGQYDPVSRPAFSRHVTEAIGRHAQFLAFPGLGHDVRFNSPCAAGIEARFIDAPSEAIDASCAARRPPIVFAAP